MSLLFLLLIVRVYILVRACFDLLEIIVVIGHMYTHIRVAMCLNLKNTIDGFIRR